MIRSLSTRLAMLATGLLFTCASAFASVQYRFDFTDLNSPGLGSYADFHIVLTYDDFVRTTGMAPIAGPAQPTSLSYDIVRAGTNRLGWWAFDEGTSATITDDQLSAGFLSFGYFPGFLFNDFITDTGVYPGQIVGNAIFDRRQRIFFEGVATLTISEIAEPGSLALILIAGSMVLVARRRPIGSGSGQSGWLPER